jgi:hypothetical protein
MIEKLNFCLFFQDHHLDFDALHSGTFIEDTCCYHTTWNSPSVRKNKFDESLLIFRRKKQSFNGKPLIH